MVPFFFPIYGRHISEIRSSVGDIVMNGGSAYAGLAWLCFDPGGWKVVGSDMAEKLMLKCLEIQL